MEKQKSIWKATLGVILLFLTMIVLTYAKYNFGKPLGWFFGTTLGFLFGIWLVEKVGPEKPTEESAIAMFLFGSLIFAALLVIILFL